ncbi:carbonic anhydrase [Rhizomicrobium electricum]|uniref:carbonic anhydrase n=1 Tax=Rhizomicrobium electricum TaxID=480070 RepID=A0ABN1FAY5_9PROT|nr:carbonic anhydrase [Rhizomicrobium electricum]NIJ50693.1 carbonic anhydrase [Rhizomicrobium electricum]
MKTLIAGYQKFRREVWPHDKDHFEALAKGQKPHTLVISCSDSRVDPAAIFSVRAGELFVIRNVASVVPPYETYGGYHGVSAAIAFAVINLEVERIVVLGHEHCGGVAAAMARTESPTPFLSQWVSLLEPAIHTCSGGDPLAVECESIRLSLGRLMTFPFIAERVENGTLQLIGAHFKISDGTLSMLDPADQVFKRVGDTA